MLFRHPKQKFAEGFESETEVGERKTSSSPKLSMLVSFSTLHPNMGRFKILRVKLVLLFGRLGPLLVGFSRRYRTGIPLSF